MHSDCPGEVWCLVIYSRSLKVGNPIASILKSNVLGIPALFGLNPVSNFMGLTVGCRSLALGLGGLESIRDLQGFDYDLRGLGMV